MERRGFLKGMLAAVAGGEALVRLATPGEAAELAVGQTALVGQPALGVEAPHGRSIGEMVFMQSRQGYVPIGILTRMSVEAGVTDMTQWGGEIQVSGPGLMSVVVAEFEGPFPFTTARRLR